MEGLRNSFRFAKISAAVGPLYGGGVKSKGGSLGNKPTSAAAALCKEYPRLHLPNCLDSHNALLIKTLLIIFLVQKILHTLFICKCLYTLTDDEGEREREKEERSIFGDDDL